MAWRSCSRRKSRRSPSSSKRFKATARPLLHWPLALSFCSRGSIWIWAPWPLISQAKRLLLAAVAGVITHVPAGLGVLEAAGLVIAERRGRERWNHLDALPIHAIQERWIGPYAAYAASMLSRLKRVAETTEA